MPRILPFRLLREIAKLHVNDFHEEDLRNARRRETCRGREALDLQIAW